MPSRVANQSDGRQRRTNRMLMDQKKALQELVTVQRVCNTAKSDLDGVCRKVQTSIMQLKSGASSAAYNESESAYWDVYTLKESLQEAEYMLQRTMDILNNNRYFGGGGRMEYAKGGKVITAQRRVDPGFAYVWIWIDDEEEARRMFDIRRTMGVFRIDEGFDENQGRYFVKFDTLKDAQVIASELDKEGIDYTLVDNISSFPSDFRTHIQPIKRFSGKRLRGNLGTWTFVETGIEDKMFAAAEKAGVEILEIAYHSKYDADMYLTANPRSAHELSGAYIELYGALPPDGMFTMPMNRVDQVGDFRWDPLKKGEYFEQSELPLED